MTELRKRGPSSKPSKPFQMKKTTKGESKTQNENSVNTILGGVFKVLLFIIVVPPMLNYAGLQKEREFLTSNLTLYDIGFSQKMFFNCSGSGKPTVILDAPTGMTSDSWVLGQAELAKLTKVCVYDRAGLGFSDAPPQLNISDPGEGAVARTLGKEGTAVRMVNDLHRIVTFSFPQERPFVLVGSELGGLVARMYAHLHPQDVNHIVMIDPISETLFDDVNNKNDVEKTENPWISYWFGHLLISFRLLQVSAMVGLSRLGLITGLMTSPLTTLNNESDSEFTIRQKHHICNPFHVQAVFDEHKGVNESLSQMKEIQVAWPLTSNISSTIISGTYYDEQLPPSLNRGWSRAVQDVIDHMDSKHHVITGADRHMIHSVTLVREALAPVVRIIKSWRVQNKV
eukprot:TRINITY_DN8992_c0_g1_i3.p1 TRINITY_DN8992_c0_g1~~TRINITY_DN8992_c0_g1_i3.p1  ORF type:complete len:399 (+),score=95.04 TRINITY_DN8992_c0_g1_i3:50-1246(+)